jgi:hypothetical protein
MSQEVIQCFSCSHYIKNSSCGACSDTSENLIQSITDTLENEITESQKDEIKVKYSCKIIQKYPDEFEKVNPLKCKYYLPSFYKMY